MKRANKKAEEQMLVSEVLKIIVAIVCLIFLIYLATSMYGLFTRQTTLEQAKSSLQRISTEVDKLNSGKETSANIYIEAPNGWEVIAWPNKDSLSMPTSCKSSSCICICPTPSLSPGFSFTKAIDRFLESCIKSGTCSDVSKPVLTLDKYNFNNPLIIKGLTSLNMSLDNNGFVIRNPQQG